MQRIKHFCSQLGAWVLECFRSEQDRYRERMIELQERILRPEPQQQQEIDMPQMRRSASLPKYSSPMRRTETYYSVHDHASSGKKEEKHGLDDSQRVSQKSEQSFFSLNSNTKSNRSSVSRRAFTKITRKSSASSRNQRKNDRPDEFKDIINDQIEMDTNEIDLVKVDSQLDNIAEALLDWNEKEYDKFTAKTTPFRFTNAEASALESNTILNETVNRVEDYYTFYFNQVWQNFASSPKKQELELNSYHGWQLHKSPETHFSYHVQNEHPGQAEATMMLLCFQTNTANPAEFLKWYNSRQVQSKIFNFHRIRLLDNSVTPVLEVEQFGCNIRGKSTFLLVRQTEIIRFENEPDCEYVVQLDCSFRKAGNFRSMLRFPNTGHGMVEIYCESSEKLSTSAQKHYQKIWSDLEALIKQRRDRWLKSSAIK